MTTNQAMTGIEQLNDDALCALAELAEKGPPFTEEDYEALFSEMDARGMFEIVDDDD